MLDSMWKKHFIILILDLVICHCFLFAQDPAAAQRYQHEAEYYQRQAESYQRDAESYLRQAKSNENDAASYLRNKNYDRARDCYRRAADAMDNYQAKINSARNAASKSEDYLKRAAEALR